MEVKMTLAKRTMGVIVSCLAVLAFGVACVSAYGPNHGSDGGYEEQWIDDTTYIVKFYANHSNELKTRNRLLLRCALLTTEHGYTYFNAVRPIEGNNDEMSIVIRFANSSGPASYDAAVIQEWFGNLVNCGKVKASSVVAARLPGIGKPCQGKLPEDLNVNAAPLTKEQIEKKSKPEKDAQ